MLKDGLIWKQLIWNSIMSWLQVNYFALVLNILTYYPMFIPQVLLICNNLSLFQVHASIYYYFLKLYHELFTAREKHMTAGKSWKMLNVSSIDRFFFFFLFSSFNSLHSQMKILILFVHLKVLLYLQSSCRHTLLNHFPLIWKCGKEIC